MEGWIIGLGEMDREGYSLHIHDEGREGFSQ